MKAPPRTSHHIPIEEDTIDSSIFSQLGLRLYDNGYLNTSVCRSSISYIDGDKGILRYRGYDIEELAEKSSFLELPTARQFETWTTRVMRHTYVHENMNEYLKSFRYDAHPMGMLVASVSAMSTFHPEASTALHGDHIYEDEAMVNKQIFRLLGKIPTLAACAYRHRIGRPYVHPSNELDFTGNFLYMMDKLSETSYRFGLVWPMHGGANEAALRMLEEIGSVENIPAFIAEVKAKRGNSWFYDPRAKLMRKIADQVFDVMGRSPLIDVAVELERIALSDDYFKTRNLYPNVDFYSGIIYKAMGFPTDFFPVLFAIARTAGWLAHWREQLHERIPIFRPAQAYDGVKPRTWVSIEEREKSDKGALRADAL
ncbi:citrate synthase-like protein [Chytridium lagenaria]|nr:citrate synthase-like protein [Chytridium lagenaria]